MQTENKGQKQLEAKLRAVNLPGAVVPTHRDNLRRLLLTNFNAESVMQNTNTSSSGQLSWFALKKVLFGFALSLPMVAVIIVFAIYQFNLNLGHIGTNDPILEVRTRESILVKAEEMAKKAEESGDYSHIVYDLDLFSASGKKRTVTIEVVYKQVEDNAPYRVGVIRDPQTGKILEATKFAVFPDSLPGQEGPGSVFSWCANCSEEDIKLLNENKPTTYRRDDSLLPEGNCGSNDGSRVMVECFGVKFIQATPYLTIDDSQDGFKANSKEEFIELMQLSGFEQILRPTKADPRQLPEFTNDKIYSLFSGNFDTLKASDVIAELESNDTVKYIGVEDVSGVETDIFEYKVSGITGDYIQRVGFSKDGSRLNLVTRKHADGEQKPTFNYRVKSLTYTASPEDVQYQLRRY